MSEEDEDEVLSEIALEHVLAEFMKCEWKAMKTVHDAFAARKMPPDVQAWVDCRKAALDVLYRGRSAGVAPPRRGARKKPNLS
jgi:hypothetical protein